MRVAAVGIALNQNIAPGIAYESYNVLSKVSAILAAFAAIYSGPISSARPYAAIVVHLGGRDFPVNLLNFQCSV